MSSKQQNQQSSKSTPEEFSAKARLRSINEARELVRQKENDADGWLIQGYIDESTADTIVRRAVEHYVIELESLIKEAQHEDIVEEDYWDGTHLGAMSLPSGDEVVFEGVGSLLDAPSVIEDEWHEEVRDDLQGASFERKTATVQIPRRIVMQAYRACNRFCAEINLDLDISKAQTYELEYVDLYEEAVGRGGDGGEEVEPE